jgi:aspartyl-tRNA synthetase
VVFVRCVTQGLMQIVFLLQHDERGDFTRACTIRSEFVLAVRGELVLRPGDLVNKPCPPASWKCRSASLRF